VFFCFGAPEELIVELQEASKSAKSNTVKSFFINDALVIF